MTPPLITAVAAAALLVLQQLLMLTVGLARTRTRIAVGTGGDATMERLVRRHGNLAESAALVLVGLALLELLMGSTLLVAALAAVFVVARLAHALSFTSPAGSHLSEGSPVFPALRVVGAFGTLAASLVIAGALIARAAGMV